MALVHLATAFVAAAFVWRYSLQLRRHLPIVCILAAIGLVHGIVPAITPASLRTIEASDASRWTSAWFALAGVLALGIGYQLHWAQVRKDPRRNRELAWVWTPRGQALLKEFFWVSLILGTIGAFLLVKSTGASILELATSARFEFRLDQNQPLAWAGTYLFHLAFAPGFLGQFLSRRYRIGGTVLAAGLTVVCFFVLFKGTRHIALGIPSGLVVGYVLSHRLTPLRMIAVGMTGFLLILGTIALYEVRKELYTSSAVDVAAKTFSLESLAQPLSRDPLNYHELFVGAVEYFPSDHPYLNGATYRRMMTFFLPGSRFPVLKPEHTARVVADVVYADYFDPEFRATVPPSLLGDAYINFWGWPGLGILMLNGMAVSWITTKVRSSILWFLAVGPHMGWFVILAPREGPYDYFVMGVILLVETALVGRLLRWWIRYTGPRQQVAPPRRNAVRAARPGRVSPLARVKPKTT